MAGKKWSNRCAGSGAIAKDVYEDYNGFLRAECFHCLKDVTVRPNGALRAHVNPYINPDPAEPTEPAPKFTQEEIIDSLVTLVRDLSP